MTTLNVTFTDMSEKVLKGLIKRGYAKTKTEALRYALFRVGQETGIVEEVEHEDALDAKTLARIEKARKQVAAGQTISHEKLKQQLGV